MEGDVLGLAALNLVLRRIRARMMCIAFDIEVAGMHPNDRAADVPGLGIPAHAIADFEGIRHNALPRYLNAQAALKFGFAVGLARLRALGGQHQALSLAALAIVFVGELVLSRVLFRLHVRYRPYQRLNTVRGIGADAA